MECSANSRRQGCARYDAQDDIHNRLRNRLRKPRILCFGDSNVWGYIPGSAHQRYTQDKRWTQLLSLSLDGFACVVEEGLNSRTISMQDQRPGKQGRASVDYITPCLASHDPLDYIFLLLGTNELKSGFMLTPSDVAGSVEELVHLVQLHKFESGCQTPKIILIAPPIINENTTYCKENDKYLGAHKKSAMLERLYEDVAKKIGCDFISAADCPTGSDGVHLSEIGHQILFGRIEQYLTERERILQLAKSDQG